MPSTRTLLIQYRYDPLDRVVSCTPTTLPSHQRFYLKDRLATEIQGAIQRSIFQQEDQLLAQQQHLDGVVETTLLATDQQRSVLHALDATQPCPLAYTAYGHRPAENGLLSLLGFNGERPDPVTGHYLLGNGYRAFNPVLMRFNSPDSISPFGKGGLNAYAYGQGDPINTVDPTGRFSLFKGTMIWLGLKTPKTKINVHGVDLRLSPERPDIEFFKKPTKPFAQEKTFGPEHEIYDVPGVKSFAEREALLQNNSDRIIMLETTLAYELKAKPKLNSIEFQKRVRAAWTERLTHQQNLADFNRDADWVTENAFKKESFLFPPLPSYEEVTHKAPLIRKQI